jgi:hypothetical protein
VGIGPGATDPGRQLVVKTDDQGDGLSLDFRDYDLNMIQSGNIFDLQHTNTTGTMSLAFGNSRRMFFDNDMMAPWVDAPDNTTTGNGTYDLGRFNRHFRRLYTKGVHTNDGSVNGGLRINIGPGGNTTPDYQFTDFAFFPFETNRTLGRSDKSWRNVYYQTLNQVSDRRKKENIKSLSYGLDKILSLKTYTYSYIADEASLIKFGFMAQDLQTDLPEVVTVGNDEMKSLSVDYVALIPILVNAIKEQQAQIDELKKRLE